MKEYDERIMRPYLVQADPPCSDAQFDMNFGERAAVYSVAKTWSLGSVLQRPEGVPVRVVEIDVDTGEFLGECFYRLRVSIEPCPKEEAWPPSVRADG